MFGAMWSEHCGYKHSRPLLGRLPIERRRGARRARRERRRDRHRRRAGGRLQGRVAQPSVSAVEPYQGAATGRRRHHPRHLHHGRAADRPPQLPALRPARRRWRRPMRARPRATATCSAASSAASPATATASASPTSAARSPSTPSLLRQPAGQRDVRRHRPARRDHAGAARPAPATSLLLVGADTGRDGIQGASFASATLGEDREERRPAVQVGNPFLEKLLMEACLELARLDGGGRDAGPRRRRADLRAGRAARRAAASAPRSTSTPCRGARAGMTPYEVLLSESQERMLIVVRPGAGGRRCAPSSTATSCTRPRSARSPTSRSSVAAPAASSVCEVPGPRAGRRRAALRDLRRSGAGRDRRDLERAGRGAADGRDAARAARLARTLRDRKPIWRRYDHMNGTNTLVGPGAGDAALLRVKGTAPRAGAGDRRPGPARIGALDPVPGRRLGGGRGRHERGLPAARCRSASPTA